MIWTGYIVNETHLDWLGALPAVLRAARAGSATAAAEHLGTTTATVIRRIGAVEAALGARLFDRTPGGLLPTAALELVLPWAEQVESAALSLLQEVQGHESAPEGVVRLALLPSVSNRFIAPEVPRLLARHPGLSLELLPGGAVVDLVRREADLALRTVKPETGDLVVQALGWFSLVVVAAPDLIARARPRALTDLPWVTWDRPLPEAQWLAAVAPDAQVVLRASELETLIAAAQAGVGALVISEPLAAVAGGLSRLPVLTPELPRAALWLVAHRALRPVPRVAAVWAWLVETFADRQAQGRFELP